MYIRLYSCSSIKMCVRQQHTRCHWQRITASIHLHNRLLSQNCSVWCAGAGTPPSFCWQKQTKCAERPSTTVPVFLFATFSGVSMTTATSVQRTAAGPEKRNGNWRLAHRESTPEREGERESPGHSKPAYQRTTFCKWNINLARQWLWLNDWSIYIYIDG